MAVLSLATVGDAAAQRALEQLRDAVQEIQVQIRRLRAAVAAVSGGGGGGATLADGDYGDVIVSGTGTVMTVDDLPEGRILGLVADLAAKTPTARTLTTTAPLTIGGGSSADLSADRTLAIANFTTAVAGVVSASSAAANFLRGSNTWSTVAQVTAALDLFTSVLRGLVPASGGGTANFLRADGAWAAPTAAPAPFYDKIIDMTGTPITFGATYDAWNVGTLGQNTLIKYITDGAPTGSNSRGVRGLVGGSDGVLATFMNMSAFTGVAQFAHETGTAGSAFHNCGGGLVSGSSMGCVTYRYDGAAAIWRHVWSTAP